MLCEECRKREVKYKIFDTENNEKYFLCEKCIIHKKNHSYNRDKILEIL